MCLLSDVLGWDFEPFAQTQNSEQPGLGRGKLTNILPDYLYRFVWEGICEEDTFYFEPWFQPTPIAIEWNFGDPFSPNNISYELYPKHKFSHDDTFEVSVIAEYPNGRREKTSREVEVYASPEPDLGPDVSICPGDTITLDAYCGPWDYFWSTGPMGTSSITVTDIYFPNAFTPDGDGLNDEFRAVRDADNYPTSDYLFTTDGGH